MRGPCGHRTGPARKPSMFFISFGIRTGPVRDPQGCRTAALWTRKGIDTTRIGKTPARASYLAARAPQGLFTGCLQSLNPCGAPIAYNAWIKTLRAPYGEAKFVRRRTWPVRAPWVDARFLFFKIAREQPVRGPGVWCDWGINRYFNPYTRLFHLYSSLCN